MGRVNRVTGLIFFFLSLGICSESIRLSLGTLHRPGPGFFPFISGVIIGTFSFILYLKNRNRDESTTKFWTVEAKKKEILLAIGGLVIYALLFEVLGFLVSSILFFIFLSRSITRQKWITTIALAILSPIVAYLIFQTWLQTQLPRGLLG